MRGGPLVVLAFLSAGPPARLAAQSRLWRPEERVVLSDFSVVEAVAASPWLVYAATTHGLIVYDRRAQRWGLPVTAVDGYPGTPVRAALADLAGDGVWLGAADGWYRYDPQLQRWDHGSVPGGVRELMLDRDDPASGLYVQGAFGWLFVPRGGLVAEPAGDALHPLPPPGRRVQPLDARTALAQVPAADAMRALILTDARLRGYQFTCAARTPDQNEVYFGTNGLGLVRMDPATGQWDDLRYGTLTARADALAPGADGVWMAGDARVGERRGLTWVSEDLTETTPREDALGRGTGVLLARRLVVAARSLWLATDGGVWSIDPSPGAGPGRRFDLGDGLPGEDVRSLAPAPDGVWVGTTRGLAVITTDGRVVRPGSFDRAVTALLAVRESLWVGSVAGLALLPPGMAEPVVPAELAAQPALRAPIVALGRLGDTIVAATGDQVAWRDPATHTWTLSAGRSDLGRLTALAGDAAAGGVWLGGEQALAFWTPAPGSFRLLRIPGDLPAPVRDLAVTGDYLWVATDSGLVRLDRRAALGGGR